MQKEFVENETHEKLLLEIEAGREKVSGLDSHTHKRLTTYVQQKRAWQRAQHAAMESEEARRLALLEPRAVFFRHAMLKPEDFPLGSHVRNTYDTLTRLTARTEPILKEHAELRAAYADARKTLENFDMANATSPRAHADAVHAVEFYGSKLKVVTPRAVHARERQENAQTSLRIAYAKYTSLVKRLNQIGELGRPLAARDVESRAREAGEVARIEFLLEYMLTPVPAARAQAA